MINPIEYSIIVYIQTLPNVGKSWSGNVYNSIYRNYIKYFSFIDWPFGKNTHIIYGTFSFFEKWVIIRHILLAQHRQEHSLDLSY